MTDQPRDKETRIVKANHLLQAKVGIGSIDEKKVARSQKVMDKMAVDFPEMGLNYLDKLALAVADARTAMKDPATINARRHIQAMTEPVMQIKGNAGMFHFALVGALANVMLNFLETLDHIDKDVIEIVDAHHKTLKLLIGNNMQGDGGDYGRQLESELKDACRRYFARQASSRKGDSAFFIDAE